LVIGGLKTQLSTVEMIVGEMEAAKVVKVGDALGGRVSAERRRMLSYVCEKLSS
jgi:hypothetical protein